MATGPTAQQPSCGCICCTAGCCFGDQDGDGVTRRVTLSLDVLLAFMAGVASILGAAWSLRKARRDERQRCDERVAELEAEYDRGIAKGLHMSERDE